MSSWRSPNVDEMVLAAFAEKGLVPPKEVAHWRVPYVANFRWDGAVHGLLPASLLWASLVGEEDAWDYTDERFCPSSCSSWLVHKV